VSNKNKIDINYYYNHNYKKSMTISISPKPSKRPNSPNLQTGLVIAITGMYIYFIKKYEDNYHKRLPRHVYYEMIYKRNKNIDSMINYWKYGILGN
jgi:hypothetical protein